MKPIVVWFRQDLRVADHPALSAAAAQGPVIPIFILDDETPDKWRWGGASRWWLHRSLMSLQQSVPLVLRHGRADDVLKQILKEAEPAALHFTRGYAPWSGKLEQRIKAICDDLGVACHRHAGFLLHEPEDIRTGQDKPYQVYTPFSRACFAQGEPRAPKAKAKIEFAKHQLRGDDLASWHLLPTKPNWAKGFEEAWQPGEEGARKCLKTFIDDALANYAEGRDRPDQQLTSHLSPHLHWGEISPHQVWYAVRSAMASSHGKLDTNGEKFLREILWREFCYHLLHHWPDFPDKPFRAEFEGFKWRDDANALHAWQKGLTGYPIVDAGMRELWTTGVMHNRVRMIVASFLTKHLLQRWQDGEAWFWDTLVDADLANNSANWQWVAGSGADASPYYRIFNPVLQGEKFDPEGIYVKRWVNELADCPPDFIHTPWKMEQPPQDYPAPIVEHEGARARALQRYKDMRKDNA